MHSYWGPSTWLNFVSLVPFYWESELWFKVLTWDQILCTTPRIWVTWADPDPGVDTGDESAGVWSPFPPVIFTTADRNRCGHSKEVIASAVSSLNWTSFAKGPPDLGGEVVVSERVSEWWMSCSNGGWVNHLNQWVSECCKWVIKGWVCQWVASTWVPQVSESTMYPMGYRFTVLPLVESG